MMEYSGHYDQTFDPTPQCPEPGCNLKLKFRSNGTYDHIEPSTNLNDRG